MTETYNTTQSLSKLAKIPNESCLKQTTEKVKLKKSSSSSSLNSSFGNLNTEIKSIIENELDLSFSSDSNSESAESKANINYFFSHQFWQPNNECFSIQKEKISKEKDSISGKVENKKQVSIPLKCGNSQSIVGISEGSNKQSTQSNEDEEIRVEHLQNVSSDESNNNSSINNEIEENEKEKGKKKEEVKIKENKEKKPKENNYLNNNMNTQNIKFNKMNEPEYLYSYDAMNYKNHNLPFFQSMYLHPQLYSFIPGYNYHTLNKKNFITNNNNLNNKLEDNKSPEKEQIENNANINSQNQYTNTYMNNMNKKMNQNQMDMIDLPLVMNNTHNNPMNYRYQKLNFNMLCCPQIQPMTIPVHKQSLDKGNNSSNFLPEINNKENTQISSQEKKTKNNNNTNIQNNTSNNSNNLCPIIGKGNNEIKINNKNFVMNKVNNNSNKGNLKGEKQFLNLDDIVTGKDTRTTVMIRNIPIKYTDQILNDDLKEFNGKYDCLYMPYDYEKNGNKGYAFINFVNPLHILYFYEKFNGKKWLHFESNKICELNCAHFQGINEIQKHAKNYKGQKKPNYYSRNVNENIIIPSKYLLKLKNRFPKIKYTENKIQKTITVKSFE